MTNAKSTDLGAAILRIATGLMLLAHGWLKISVFTIPGTVGYFDSLGLPAIFAYLTILGEVGGGLALILGLAVRPVALALIPVLLGATWVHAGNGWLFSSNGGGWEFPLYWAVTLLVIALLGRGAFALRLPVLDKLLGRFA